MQATARGRPTPPRRRPRPGDKWHLDEMVAKVNEVHRYLWRAVDHVRRVLVTDELRSYGVAKRLVLPGAEHRRSRYPN